MCVCTFCLGIAARDFVLTTWCNPSLTFGILHVNTVPKSNRPSGLYTSVYNTKSSDWELYRQELTDITLNRLSMYHILKQVDSILSCYVQ